MTTDAARGTRSRGRSRRATASNGSGDGSVRRLVIVESPAKARTISQYLGDDYVVESSIGHIRDLPSSAAEIPAKYKKEKWARLGVNIDAGFNAGYVAGLIAQRAGAARAGGGDGTSPPDRED